MNFQHVIDLIQPMFVPLYLGPETVMPVASLLATIIGFLLLFGQRLLKIARNILGRFFVRFRESPAVETDLPSEPSDEI